MKIDLSTIFLVIFLVLPGLFSRRSQNSITLRSFETQGATEELAEFVLQGVAVHLILIFFFAFLAAVYGGVFLRQPAYVFHRLDRLNAGAWAKLHPAESILVFGSYVLLTFVVGYFFGLLCGIWRTNRPFTSFLLRRASWLQRFGVTGTLGERPIIYQVLAPKIAADGTPSIVFIEVEMKGALGFYSGQVRQYAVVKDGEPHKLVYLVEAWFKPMRSDPYMALEAGGVLIDLADVAVMKVDQVRVEHIGTGASLPPDPSLSEDLEEASSTE